MSDQLQEYKRLVLRETDVALAALDRFAAAATGTSEWLLVEARGGKDNLPL
jgi:hypothetical protein